MSDLNDQDFLKAISTQAALSFDRIDKLFSEIDASLSKIEKIIIDYRNQLEQANK